MILFLWKALVLYVGHILDMKNASFPSIVNWLKFMPLQLMMFVTVHD